MLKGSLEISNYQLGEVIDRRDANLLQEHVQVCSNPMLATDCLKPYLCLGGVI